MKMPDSGARPAIAGRVLGLVVILTLAASSGAVIGIANASDSSQPVSSSAAAAVAEAQPETFEATLAVQEPPEASAAGAAAPAAGASKAAAKPKSTGIPVLNLNIPTTAGGGAGAGPAGSSAKAVKCARFDDPKISWLLEQVAKTRAEHPEMAAGADKLAAELRAALGKNMCASEAQQIIGQLCTDPAVVRVMNQMVSRLPFFIKPMVGDPCSADLVSVLNKVGKFVPGLSSEPS
jgi:hypothetical protein